MDTSFKSVPCPARRIHFLDFFTHNLSLQKQWADFYGLQIGSEESLHDARIMIMQVWLV